MAFGEEPSSWSEYAKYAIFLFVVVKPSTSASISVITDPKLSLVSFIFNLKSTPVWLIARSEDWLSPVVGALVNFFRDISPSKLPDDGVIAGLMSFPSAFV